MRLTLRKDTSFDLPPARNARKWQLAKEEAARQGRGGDIREIINIYTLMALLPTYKSHAAVQKAADDADATTRSGKPIAAATARAYAQVRRTWRRNGMAGASRLAEALGRDYGHFSRQDHLDAADHHEQSQHDGSKADQACHRIAAWSHQIAADMAKSCRPRLVVNVANTPLRLTKAATHKYISREKKGDHFEYTYPDDSKSAASASTAASSTAAAPSIDADRRDVEHPHLNVQQKEAVAFYQSDSFLAFNDSLRDPEGTAEMLGENGAGAVAAMLKDADTLKGAIALSQTKAPIKVFRGLKLRPDAFGAGKMISDKGFVSTTTDPKTAHQFSGPQEPIAGFVPVVISATLPKGTHALAVSHHTLGPESSTGYDEEHELLVSPGTAFKVISTQVIDGVHHVEAELVSPSSPKKDVQNVTPQEDAVRAVTEKPRKRARKPQDAPSLEGVKNVWSAPDGSDERRAGGRANVALLAARHTGASSQDHADIARAHLRAAKVASKQVLAGDRSKINVQQLHSSAYHAHRKLAERSKRVGKAMRPESEAAQKSARPRLSLRKAGSPSYTSREMVNGSWRYHYAGDAHEGIGKTQSGKPIPHPGHAEYRNHMPGDTKFADYSQQDHADAHKVHAEAGKKLAAEADDIQHAYATRHGNTSVRENSQQADASAAHFRSATDARTMAQAHVDAAVTHARLGTDAAKSQTRRKLTVKTLSKADGHKYQSREMGAGGHWKYTYADGAGGSTGKHGAQQPQGGAHASASATDGLHGIKDKDFEQHYMNTQAGHNSHVLTMTRSGRGIYNNHDHPMNASFTAADHEDAAKIHKQEAARLGSGAKAAAAEGMPNLASNLQTKSDHHSAQYKKHAASAKKPGIGKSVKRKEGRCFMQKSLTDPLGDITVESVYAPMGFARISDVDGTEIKTDAGSIDELAALVADMASYNAGTVVGGVLPAQRDKSTVPTADEPPVAPQTTTIDVSGNAPADVPETEVVTKSCAALHSTLAAQWADAQSIVMGMPTLLPPDAPEGDARFALIGQ